MRVRPCSRHHPNLELITIQSSTPFGLRSLNGHLERCLQWDQQQWKKRSMHLFLVWPTRVRYPWPITFRLWKWRWDGRCIRGLWVILLDWPHEGQGREDHYSGFRATLFTLHFPHSPLINCTQMGENWFCHCKGGSTKEKHESRVVWQGARAGNAKRVAVWSRGNRERGNSFQLSKDCIIKRIEL